jgi:hypothetical protein
MKRQLLSLSFLALGLLGALIIGASLGLAQTAQTVDNPRPTPTPVEPTEPLEPRPAPVPAGPDIPLMPDLVVEEIRVVPPSPYINEEATILVTIKNVGPLDVRVEPPPPNNFWSDLYIDPSVVPIQLGQDGEASWGCQAIWMCSGCSRTLVTTWTFDDVKTYALWAQVDTDGHVAEGNENNNVTGPLNVSVVARDQVRHQTHQDFQNGLASGLDLSHPDGVIRRGIFDEPSSEPGVYTPDWMINDTTGTLPTSVNQVKPTLTGDGQGRLFAAWEDGRNGGVYNRDIYFSSSAAYPWETWGADVRINDDAGQVNQVSPALTYDRSRGRLYAAWQDGRNGDFDIYFAYSDNNGSTWSANQQISIDPINSPDAHQLNPSIAVGPSKGGGGDAVYVVWQDQRNGNDDVYIIRSGNGGASWGPAYFVTDDPEMTAQNQVAPSVGVDGQGQVFVTWEDWRDPIHPEIYVSWSWDEGETFGKDVPVSISGEGTSYRVQPTMVVSTTREIVEEWDPQQEITVTVEVDITAIHLAWQEGQGVNADIYYGFATYDYYQPETCPWPYDFCFKGMQKINGFVIDSDYVLPPDTGPTWSIEPSWQGGVTMAPASVNDLTYCHAGSLLTYTKGVFLAWSDARSYDDWRYEIHTRRIASPGGNPKSFQACEDQSTGVVNDNAKIYAYRNDLEVYRVYKPAATRQLDPSIYASPPSAPTFQSLMAVAWDDDRWDLPLEPNTVRNRDIFMTKTGYNYPQGVYISEPIDSRTVAKWYVLSWYAVTPYAGDVLLQTRFGSTPYPPQDDVAANGWTRWTGNPSSTSVGCLAGVGCYYDAPGRHIVGPGGNDWPESRYIQYKVIINGFSRITALSQVTIHYEGPFSVSVPMAMKRKP